VKFQRNLISLLQFSTQYLDGHCKLRVAAPVGAQLPACAVQVQWPHQPLPLCWQSRNGNILEKSLILMFHLPMKGHYSMDLQRSLLCSNLYSAVTCAPVICVATISSNSTFLKRETSPVLDWGFPEKCLPVCCRRFRVMKMTYTVPKTIPSST
jgi:hypothetical protein